MTIEGDVSTMRPHTSGSMTRPTGNAASTAKEETAAVGQTKRAVHRTQGESGRRLLVQQTFAPEHRVSLIGRARFRERDLGTGYAPRHRR